MPRLAPIPTNSMSNKYFFLFAFFHKKMVVSTKQSILGGFFCVSISGSGVQGKGGMLEKVPSASTKDLQKVINLPEYHFCQQIQYFLPILEKNRKKTVAIPVTRHTLPVKLGRLVITALPV